MSLKLVLLSCMLLICVFYVKNSYALTSGRCLDSSRITSCSPKCTDDSNCLGSKICCQNICGHKSCSDQNQYASGGNKDYKGNSNSKGGSGTYCGNKKCSTYEKCEFNRSTKQQQCVRN